jgi:hypothetical protein
MASKEDVQPERVSTASIKRDVGIEEQASYREVESGT